MIYFFVLICVMSISAVVWLVRNWKHLHCVPNSIWVAELAKEPRRGIIVTHTYRNMCEYRTVNFDDPTEYHPKLCAPISSVVKWRRLYKEPIW